MLRCVAVCCSVLQCVAVCCSVLQCVAGLFSVEYRALLSISKTCALNKEEVVQHTATHYKHCNTSATHLQHICNTCKRRWRRISFATRCNTLLHHATHLLIKHARGAGARFHLIKSSSTKIAIPTNARRNIQNTFCTLRVFECE